MAHIIHLDDYRLARLDEELPRSGDPIGWLLIYGIAIVAPWIAYAVWWA
jgi:hypothetical protein